MRTGVKNQNAAIIKTTKMIENIQDREVNIIKTQGTIHIKTAKWAKS